MKTESVSVVSYTKGEEFLNAATHALGFVLCYFIAAACLIPALSSGEVLRIVSAGLYLFGTFAMFLTSVLYHSVRNTEKKTKLRVLDHTMIFFAVAGTATGCVPAVYDTGGLFFSVLMLVCAWTGAVGGLIMTLFFFEKTTKARMLLYIGTAFVCAVSGCKAYFHLPVRAFLCFLIGSVLLLTGAVFLRLGKRISYFHTVFHLFVLAGLFIYYLGISSYCY